MPFTRHGKPDGTVAVSRVDARSLRSTFEKHGRVTRTITVTVAPNDKTLEMTIHNPHTGATTTMIHDKVS